LFSLHLQSIKESAISKQLTICQKKIGYQILLENKHFKTKVIVHSQDQKKLEIKLDIFSSKQQRFIKQRKFGNLPYMVSHSNTLTKPKLSK
jgi:hypothetical protein